MSTSVHLLRYRVHGLFARSRPLREGLNVLSALHYQNARLGHEYGKPARLIQSAIAETVVDPAEIDSEISFLISTLRARN